MSNKPTIAATAWPFPTSATAQAAIKHHDRPAAVLARIITMALALREGSYDHEASDAAQADATRKWQEACKQDKNAMLFGPDYAQFYRQALTACCWVAAKKHGMEEMAQAAYIMLGWSNDSLEWAEAVLETKYAVIPYDESMFADVPKGWRTPGGEPMAEGEANDDTFALPA